jgi:hypothetical protein
MVAVVLGVVVAVVGLTLAWRMRLTTSSTSVRLIDMVAVNQVDIVDNVYIHPIYNKVTRNPDLLVMFEFSDSRSTRIRQLG